MTKNNRTFEYGMIAVLAAVSIIISGCDFNSGNSNIGGAKTEPPSAPVVPPPQVVKEQQPEIADSEVKKMLAELKPAADILAKWEDIKEKVRKGNFSTGSSPSLPPVVPKADVLAAPNLRTVNVLSHNTAAATWDASEGAADYELSWKKYGTSGGFQTVTTGGQTSYTAEGLTADSTYYFFVTALDGSGNKSGESKRITVSLPKVPEPEPPVPLPPKMQTATAMGENAVKVSWTEPEGATDYELSWKKSGTSGSFQTVKTDGKADYLVEGLAAGTAYDFFAAALNRKGKKSGNSAPLTASTKAIPIPVPEPVLPKPPEKEPPTGVVEGKLLPIENLKEFVEDYKWSRYGDLYRNTAILLQYGTEKLQQDLESAETALKNSSPFDNKAELRTELNIVRAEIEKEQKKIAAKRFYCDTEFTVGNFTETTAEITSVNYDYDGALRYNALWKRLQGGDGLWMFCFPSFKCKVAKQGYGRFIFRLEGNTADMKELYDNARNYIVRIYLTELQYDEKEYDTYCTRGRVVRFEIRKKGDDSPPFGGDPFAKGK